MLGHNSALWRVDYRTDLTRASAPVCPIGYFVEARWSDDVRWLGVLFRKRLSPIETAHVNYETWPEMKDLKPFMETLFDRAWDAELPTGEQLPTLGSTVLAGAYGMQSSLQFVEDELDLEISSEDPEQSFNALYSRLLGLHDRLTPTMSAPIVQMPKRILPTAPLVRPQRADVAQKMMAA